MKQMARIALGLGGMLAMAACAASPKSASRYADEAPVDGSAIRPDPDLSPQERVLVGHVIHKMLEATAPQKETESSETQSGEDAMTVRVYVYDQRIYNAAVAIVKACRLPSR